MITQVNNAFNKQNSLADLEAEKERKRKEDVEKAKQAAKPQDKSRPISSTPISGTPWAVVWTGDSRVLWVFFFYVSNFMIKIHLQNTASIIRQHVHQYGRGQKIS